MDASCKHVLALPQPCECQAQFVPEVGQRSAAHVAACYPLAPAPHAFIRIKVCGIAWSGEQFEPLGGSGCKELLNLLATMNCRTIPH